METLESLRLNPVARRALARGARRQHTLQRGHLRGAVRAHVAGAAPLQHQPRHAQATQEGFEVVALLGPRPADPGGARGADRQPECVQRAAVRPKQGREAGPGQAGRSQPRQAARLRGQAGRPLEEGTVALKLQPPQSWHGVCFLEVRLARVLQVQFLQERGGAAQHVEGPDGVVVAPQAGQPPHLHADSARYWTEARATPG